MKDGTENYLTLSQNLLLLLLSGIKVSISHTILINKWTENVIKFY